MSHDARTRENRTSFLCFVRYQTIRIFAGGSLLLLPTTGACAQDSLHLSLKNAVELALESHPDIQTGLFELHQYEIQARVAKNAMLPRVQAVAELDNALKIPIKAAPNGNGDLIYANTVAPLQASAGIQVSQPLFDLACWKGRSEALAQTQVALQSLDQMREATAASVVDAWCRAWVQERVVELSAERVAQAETLETIVQAQLDAGSARESDLSRIKVQLSNLQGDLANARRNREELVNRLNLLVGNRAGLAVVLDGVLDEAAPERGDSDRITERSDWRLLGDQEELSKRALERTQAMDLPVLSLKARVDELSFAQKVGALGGRWDADATVGLALVAPIFEGFDHRNRNALAQLRLEDIRRKRRRVEFEARRDLEDAWRELATSEQILEIQAHNLELARNTQREMEARFQAGSASLSDLLEAEGAVVEARRQQLDAIGRRFQSIMALRHARGTLLTDLKFPTSARN